MRANIEKMVYGGDGLARQDGAAVFVPFTLPGEEVELQIVERKKSFWRGEATSLYTASADRAAPPCPHFTDCGGCQYQHAIYDAQLRYKEQILRETLRRIGHLEGDRPITLHASPPLHYRNRAQWKVRPMEDGIGAAIGYMRAASSSLCAVNECPILSPLLEQTLAALRDLLRDDPRFQTLREVEAFADSEDQHIILTAEFAGWPKGSPQLAQTLVDRLPVAQSVLLRDAPGRKESVSGAGFLVYHAAENAYRVSHGSFFQVNRFMVDKLMERVLIAAGEGKTAMDLFSGVGLFSLPLTKNFKHVFAVESSLASARDLDANTEPVSNRIEAWHADVTQFLRKTAPAAADVAVLDPPRAGLPTDALHRLGKLQPARIVYVSCEPSTLARDLAGLREKGYALTGMELFDLFPQTYHIETLAQLERKK